MDFPVKTTIKSCEKFLDKISSNDDFLVLPLGTESYAFAGMGAAIQAVITWCRRNNGGFISLRQSSRDNYDYEGESLRLPHKFAAVMLSKSVRLSGSDEEIKLKINKEAKQVIQYQHKSSHGSSFGGLCWVGFVDHSSLAFNPFFYSLGSHSIARPKSDALIGAALDSMIRRSVSVKGGIKLFERKFMSQISQMIYELFANTHEHGILGKDRNSVLGSSVRFIYTNAVNLSEAGVQSRSVEDPAIKRYINYDDDGHRYIELGVVDSGLGYLLRWTSDHPDEVYSESISDEYALFRRCFLYRSTSSGMDNKGNGLPKVMMLLTNLGGFLKVRTGRLSLYRDFRRNPYADDDACDFYDWHNEGLASNKLTTCAVVAGVSISVLIPLEKKQ